MYEVTDNLGQPCLHPGDLYHYLCLSKQILLSLLFSLSTLMFWTTMAGHKREAWGGWPDGETDVSSAFYLDIQQELCSMSCHWSIHMKSLFSQLTLGYHKYNNIDRWNGHWWQSIWNIKHWFKVNNKILLTAQTYRIKRGSLVLDWHICGVFCPEWLFHTCGKEKERQNSQTQSNQECAGGGTDDIMFKISECSFSIYFSIDKVQDRQREFCFLLFIDNIYYYISVCYVMLRG